MRNNFHNSEGSLQQRIKKFGISALTNREFAEIWQPFRDACKRLNVLPSARQAGKYRRKEGVVYNA